jgi:hypothetical protein
MGRATGKHANKEGEKVEIVEDNPGKEGLEGVGVGALNVYLVVFADGVVSVSILPIVQGQADGSSISRTSQSTPNAFSTACSRTSASRPRLEPTGSPMA